MKATNEVQQLEGEMKTTDEMQQHTAAPHPRCQEATGRITQLLFSTQEVARLTQLNEQTLVAWCRKGWIKPAVTSTGGRGKQHQFSAWQTLGIAILSGALSDLKLVKSYLGRNAVVRAMEALSKYDDELLLSEDQQDAYHAENAAKEIASASLTADVQLSPAVLEAVARIVDAIDKKAKALKQERNRLS